MIKDLIIALIIVVHEQDLVQDLITAITLVDHVQDLITAITLIVVASLLGVFLTQSLANDNIKIDNSGNEGGNVHQTVNINNQDNIANINNLNGWNSWDSVCDYGRGFAATRLFNKKICIITKMDKSTFPSMDQLSTIAKDKKTPPNTQLVTYTINQSPVVNIGDYGEHIESLCKGLKTFIGQEMPDNGEGFALCSSSSIITILGISFCF
ncbi:gastrokine-1-like [Rhinophrynus dorsalis]